MKKVFLKTYGCQMNESDSEIVRSILKGEGYAFTDKEEEADIVLLNTCSVRENAHRKVFGHIHEIYHRRGQSSKKTSPLLLGILGCMATGLKEELINNKALKIDLIAGPDSYRRLPELLENIIGVRSSLIGNRVDQRSKKTDKRSTINDQRIDISLSEFETYSDICPERVKGVNAWIAIMRGCNNFCSFCIVPYTRGRERSRPSENIIEETKRLVRDGYKQVTLLGQNVNSYHHDGIGFTQLIEKVSEVTGIKRIRFMSPNPKDFPEGLIELIASNKKTCKHIHLPLQAGNDRILKLMNRPYTKTEFLGLVDRVRSVIPDVAITTDIIVGFPTETDEEFEDTVDVMKKVEFDAAFIFKYSVRQGTLASRKYPDDVNDGKKTERIVELNGMQKDASLRRNLAYRNKTIEVLIEKEASARSEFTVHGRTDSNKLVILPKGDYHVGDLVNANITGATPHVLRGEVV